MTIPRVIRDAYWQVPAPVVRRRRRLVTVRAVSGVVGLIALGSYASAPLVLEPWDRVRCAVSLVVFVAASGVVCYQLVDRWLS